MWPFRTKFITAANWEPLYYAGPSDLGISAMPVGHLLTTGGQKVPKKQPYEWLSWGDMSAAIFGHRALEAIMGLFTLRHTDCSKHFWCRDEAIVLVAECYVANAPGGSQSRTYVGVYLWQVMGVQPVTDIGVSDGTGALPGGHVTTADKPAMKILLFPMPDGQIQTVLGRIRATTEGGSFNDQGVIDEETAETLFSCSRRVGRLPLLHDSIWEGQSPPPPSYAIERRDGQWHVAQCWKTSQSAVWAALPAATQLKEIVYSVK